jgi:protein phosphatase
VGLWEKLETDWIVMDAEIMPWSAKAQDLLKQQYAPVGSAGRAALSEAVTLLECAADQGLDTTQLRSDIERRRNDVASYIEAYGRYCWPTSSLDDLRVAPFHVLATAGGVHVDRDHLWHLEIAEALHEADEGLFIATRHIVVDLTNAESMERGVAWWYGLTEAGGEGMVVKPLNFVVKGKKGLVQPALKCRGREYLRIIYGPEYTLPEHLDRLRQRGVRAKRSLAAREFALGLEGLERFVRGEPLRRIHECAFAVLALESEPVDPRL